MGESFCVLHRIAPVVGVSVIGKDLEVDAIIRKNKKYLNFIQFLKCSKLVEPYV